MTFERMKRPYPLPTRIRVGKGGYRISKAIDNRLILCSVWAFQVIPVNQNSYEILTFSRFLFNS